MQPLRLCSFQCTPHLTFSFPGYDSVIFSASFSESLPLRSSYFHFLIFMNHMYVGRHSDLYGTLLKGPAYFWTLRHLVGLLEVLYSLYSIAHLYIYFFHICLKLTYFFYFSFSTQELNTEMFFHLPQFHLMCSLPIIQWILNRSKHLIHFNILSNMVKSCAILTCFTKI